MKYFKTNNNKTSASTIEEILDSMLMHYKKEVALIGNPNQVKKSKLRFDYYLPTFNLLIEYDGLQHFKYVEHFHENEDGFAEQCHKDNIKNQWCIDNQINLLRVPYSITYDELLMLIVKAISFNGEFQLRVEPITHNIINLNPNIKSLDDAHYIINGKKPTVERIRGNLNSKNLGNNLTVEQNIIEQLDQLYELNQSEQLDQIVNSINNHKLIARTKEEKIIYQFVEYLKDNDYLDYEIVCITALKHKFNDWLKEQNHYIKLSNKIFYSRLRDTLEKFGFAIDHSKNYRIQSIDILKHNPYCLMEVNDLDDKIHYYSNYKRFYNKKEKTQIAYNPDNHLEPTLIEIYKEYIRTNNSKMIDDSINYAIYIQIAILSMMKENDSASILFIEKLGISIDEFKLLKLDELQHYLLKLYPN